MTAIKEYPDEEVDVLMCRNRWVHLEAGQWCDHRYASAT
jgi:hypothetical protein